MSAGVEFTAVSSNGLHALLISTKGAIVVHTLMNRLSPDEFTTASNDGLWKILGTEKGPDIVASLMDRLGGATFATVSSRGLWSVLGKDDGQRTVESGLDQLDGCDRGSGLCADIGATAAASNSGLWSWMRAGTGARLHDPAYTESLNRWLAQLNSNDCASESDDAFENVDPN